MCLRGCLAPFDSILLTSNWPVYILFLLQGSTREGFHEVVNSHDKGRAMVVKPEVYGVERASLHWSKV